MIVIIRQAVALSVEMVMEGTNIFPSVRRCRDGAERHCEVLSSRLTGPVINDDRVWSCSSIRRRLYPGSPFLLTARTERERDRHTERERGEEYFSPLSLSLSVCLQNKTLTSTP